MTRFLTYADDPCDRFPIKWEKDQDGNQWVSYSGLAWVLLEPYIDIRSELTAPNE